MGGEVGDRCDGNWTQTVRLSAAVLQCPLLALFAEVEATVHTLFHPSSLNLPKLLEPLLPSGDWKDLVEKKTHLEETNAVLRLKLFFF